MTLREIIRKTSVSISYLKIESRDRSSRASLTPDAVAAVFENQQLTYRQLNSQANQLAHYLQQLGAAPEVLVGLCVERSLDAIVGLLGIIKAGAAYLPLDPTYPQERLNFMLEDAQVSILVTQQHLAQNLTQPENYGVFSVVCLDSDREIIARQSSRKPNYKYPTRKPSLRHLHIWFNRKTQRRSNRTSGTLQLSPSSNRSF